MNDILGWLGLLLINGFYLPQQVKLFRTRAAGDLALSGYLTLLAGLLSYLVYSIQQGNPVFIAGNLVGAANCMLTIGMIIRYRRK